MEDRKGTHIGILPDAFLTPQPPDSSPARQTKAVSWGAGRIGFSSKRLISGKACLISHKEVLSHGTAVLTGGSRHFSGFPSGGSVSDISHPDLGQRQLVTQGVC